MSHTYCAKDGLWQTVEQALWALTVPDLKVLARTLPGRSPRGTKENLIAGICRQLVGKSLRDLWSRLDALQQAAVAQAAHDEDGRFRLDGFRLRHGEVPHFGDEKPMSVGFVTPSLLCLFIYGAQVPHDLRELLLEFVPRPEPQEIKTLAGDPPPRLRVKIEDTAKKQRSRLHRVLCSDSEHRAVTELSGVLRLVDSGRIAATPKTGQITAASGRLVRKVLEDDDFFAETNVVRRSRSGSRTLVKEGAIRAFAWPRLLLVGGLVRPSGTRMVLTKQGRQVLREPSYEALRALWSSWLLHDWSADDELLRISELRGVSTMGYGLTDLVRRRAAVSAALADCPVGMWVAVDDFFAHVRTAGHDFDVVIRNGYWQLSIDDYPKQELDRYADDDLWLILQGRFILCLLFEYAATLGLIDVAYTTPVEARTDVSQVSFSLSYLSRYDGLQFFRLTGFGSFCLGCSASHVAETPAPVGLRVTARAEVKASAELPAADRLLLGHYGEPSATGRAFKLNRTGLLKAVEHGHSIDELRQLLKARSTTNAIPARVESLLLDCEERSRCVRTTGTARLLECSTGVLAREISTSRRLKKLCMRAGDKTIVVRAEDWSRFQAALRMHGYALPDTDLAAAQE